MTHKEKTARLGGAGVLARPVSQDPQGGVLGVGFCVCGKLEVSAVGRRRGRPGRRVQTGEEALQTGDRC